MTAIYALYADGRDAQRAVDGLRAAGVAADAITVISARPMEEFEFGTLQRTTWMWYIASGGGLCGLALATWLSYVTETSWPLPTGGMPIVSWWPNLIIMFELMMLGAILATVGTLVVSGGLGRRRGVLYDPAINDGRILVGVEHPHDDVVLPIERALLVHPDTSIKRV